MERWTKNRALVMLLAAIFIISLLALLNNLTPTQSLLSSDLLDTLNSNNSEEEIIVPEKEEQVITKPLSDEEWKPKDWGKLNDALERIIKPNLRVHRKDKILLTAVANHGMGEYTLNWIKSLKKCGLDDKFVVFAIDEKMVELLTDAGYSRNVVLIPDTWYHKQLSGEFEGWKSEGYTPITHAKSLVVERLLYADITVWFSDVDIVFTSPHIYEYLTMKLNSRKVRTETLFSQETEQKIVNSGFYIMRPTLMNKRILDSSIYIQDKEPKVTQQGAINRVLDDLNLSYQTSPIALLDLMLFPQGQLYFDRNIPTKYNMTPMIVHANYRVGENKKKDLQKFGLWYI
ncbi:hypothetical protein RMATCC62417_05576 [Rhizopus microsporus]|nr:hypothetical protein RMATCC62417_05576 [Rhizopus microsporus]